MICTDEDGREDDSDSVCDNDVIDDDDGSVRMGYRLSIICCF